MGRWAGAEGGGRGMGWHDGGVWGGKGIEGPVWQPGGEGGQSGGVLEVWPGGGAGEGQGQEGVGDEGR